MKIVRRNSQRAKKVRSSRQPIALLALLAAHVVSAYDGSTRPLLVVDIEGKPVAGIRVLRSGVPSHRTTESGWTDLLLAPGDETGKFIAIDLPVKESQEWLLVTRQLVVPSPEESDPLTVTLIQRATFRELARSALDSVDSRSSSESLSVDDVRRIVREQLAANGIARDQLADIVSSFAETNDLLDKGIAALVTGDLSGAEVFLGKSLERAEAKRLQAQRSLESADEELSSSAQYLGAALRSQAKYREAARAYARASELRPEDVGLLSKLGATLYLSGRLYEARATLQEALRLAEVQGLSRDQQAISARHNLALTLSALGDHEEAQSLMEYAYRSESQTLGEDHTETLASLSGIASILSDQGKISEAVGIWREVANKRILSFGTANLRSLTDLTNLANGLRQLGRVDEARSILEEILPIQARVLGEDHPTSLGAVAVKALVLEAQGDFPGALALYNQYEGRVKAALGVDHHLTLRFQYNKAHLLLRRGALAESSTLFERIFEKRKEALGQNHRDTLLSGRHFGRTLFQLGQLVRSEAVFEMVLEGFERTLGEHRETFVAASDLALALRQQEGKKERALSLLKDVLRRHQRLSGDDDPNLPVYLNNICATELDLGHLMEAVASCRQSIALNEGFIRPYIHLGRALREQARYQEAAVVVEKGLAIDSKQGELWQDLGQIYATMGKSAEAERAFANARSLVE